MNAKIENICTGLRDFAQSLKQEAKKEIQDALPKTGIVRTHDNIDCQQSYVSNPERPWMVAGGMTLAIGVLGAIFSDANWPYVVGGAGLASILYGQTKKKPQNGSGGAQPLQPVSGYKSYEVAEKVIEISKMVERKWRSKVEECKVMVQKTIDASSASAELKDSLLSQTYTTERVTVDFDAVISRLDSEPASSYRSILSGYEGIVSGCIDKAAADQIAIYINISQKL